MNGIEALMKSVAGELHCQPTDLGQRLVERQKVWGAQLLPPEIGEAWDGLSLDAKSVAVLFAKSLIEEHERRWDAG
jgi:hypothetical protein